LVLGFLVWAAAKLGVRIPKAFLVMCFRAAEKSVAAEVRKMRRNKIATAGGTGL
jgi:hypothetical protein